MANCQTVTGLLTLVVGLIASSVSFVAPFWLRNASWKEEQGLWGICYNQRDGREYWWRSCQWFFEDNFAWENSLPSWWKACQILFAFAIVVMLATFLLACVHLCCYYNRYSGMTFALSGLVATSLGLMVVSLGVFGGMAEVEHEVDLYGNFTYRWGFYLGCGAMVPLLASFVCYLWAGIKERHSGYKRAPQGGNPGMQGYYR